MLKYEIATWEPWEKHRENCGITIKALRGEATVEIQGSDLLVLHREKSMVKGARIPMAGPLPFHGSAITYLRREGDEIYLGGSSHPEVITPMGFPCDERMATLLHFLHEEGIETRFSCQGDPCSDGDECDGECILPPRLAYIMFEDAEDVAEVLEMVEEAGYFGYADGQSVRFESEFLDIFPESGFPPRVYPRKMTLRG